MVVLPSLLTVLLDTPVTTLPDSVAVLFQAVSWVVVEEADWLLLSTSLFEEPSMLTVLL